MMSQKHVFLTEIPFFEKYFEQFHNWTSWQTCGNMHIERYLFDESVHGSKIQSFF